MSHAKCSRIRGEIPGFFFVYEVGYKVGYSYIRKTLYPAWIKGFMLVEVTGFESSDKGNLAVYMCKPECSNPLFYYVSAFMTM